jgi:thiamine biosynthesis lipoprotein
MNKTKFSFEAIGTSWEIDINDPLSKKEENFLLSKIQERIKEFDLNYSRFKENSLVTKMSKEKGDYRMPSDADKMISLYKKIYDLTEAKVTPLIGQVLVDAGYDANYSLVPKELKKPLSWEETIEWNNPILQIKIPSLLDFGAGGKGYLVDIVSEIIEKEGAKSYTVDAGGDIRSRVSDNHPIKIGLENPRDKSEVLGVANILNQSICGSAGNRRKWGKFNHIINPETLNSPDEIEAVWVIADETMVADILTTAIIFTDLSTLLSSFHFEYLILWKDFSVTKSDGFNAELFS